MPAATPGEGIYRREILIRDVPNLAKIFGDALWCQPFTHRADNPPVIAVVAREDKLAIVQQFTKAAAEGYLKIVVSTMSARDHAFLRQLTKDTLWYSDRGNKYIRSAEVLRLHDEAFQSLLKKVEKAEQLLPKEKYRRLTFEEITSRETRRTWDIVVKLSQTGGLRENPARYMLDINFPNSATRTPKMGRFLKDNGFELIAA
jgi:hypothetical protein